MKAIKEVREKIDCVGYSDTDHWINRMRSRQNFSGNHYWS